MGKNPSIQTHLLRADDATMIGTHENFDPRAITDRDAIRTHRPRDWRQRKDSLLVHVEVQVRLSEHDPIEHDVEHDAEEEGAVAANEGGQELSGASQDPKRQVHVHFLNERPHLAECTIRLCEERG